MRQAHWVAVGLVSKVVQAAVLTRLALAKVQVQVERLGVGCMAFPVEELALAD